MLVDDKVLLSEKILPDWEMSKALGKSVLKMKKSIHEMTAIPVDASIKKTGEAGQKYEKNIFPDQLRRAGPPPLGSEGCIFHLG